MRWSEEFFDYIIVGAGLQGGLLAHAINHYQPQATVLLIEQGKEIGGNHTWSFHEGDVPSSADEWLAPLVTSRWSSYSVRFPNMERHVNIPYASIDSRRFGQSIVRLCESSQPEVIKTPPISASFLRVQSPAVVTADSVGNVTRASLRPQAKWLASPQSNLSLRLERPVDFVSSESIWTADARIDGRVVIDCRGPDRAELHSVGCCGYQKFWGFEIELEEPWPELNPIVMDGCLSQAKGFRFMYTLPFSQHRVLVEDTQFSSIRNLNRDDCFRNVSAYIKGKTGSRGRVIREEFGCLPMPWTGALMPTAQVPLKGGFAGGWFHAATGYTLPLAIRFADTVAKTPADLVVASMKRLAADSYSRARQARFLNRLLFKLVSPAERYEIFQRFYRVLSDDAIRRFYAHEFTGRDLSRILVGRPPSRLTPFQFINSFLKR